MRTIPLDSTHLKILQYPMYNPIEKKDYRLLKLFIFKESNTLIKKINYISKLILLSIFKKYTLHLTDTHPWYGSLPFDLSNSISFKNRATKKNRYFLSFHTPEDDLCKSKSW